MTIDRLRRLAADLLPSQPVYVLSSEDGLPAHTLMPSAWGQTSRTFDAALRPWLESNGRWEGRRPAIWLNTEAIAEHARARTGDVAEAERFEAGILAAVLCHELSHVTESSPDLTLTTPALTEFSEALVAYSVLRADADLAAAGLPPFFGHGAHFIRGAIHARARLGNPFDVDLLFEGAAYGLSPASDYGNALACEPGYMAGLSLFDLPQTTPRPAFVSLWRRDVNAWLEAQANLSGEARRYCERSLSLFEV